MENLKSSYQWSLRAFTALHIAIFWVVIISRENLSLINSVFESLTIEDSLYMIFAPIITLLLGGWLPAELKAKLIYWRYNNPLPGSSAFSLHMHNDHRIDPQLLEKNWGTLPVEPVEQNRLWYRMYKAVDSDIRVHEAHRDSLFSRDLNGYAVIFLLVFFIPALISDASWTVTLIYISFLMAQYLLTMLAARTYGRRFVCNVLALSSL